MPVITCEMGLRHIPEEILPAKMYGGFMGKAETLKKIKQEISAVQFAPLLKEEKTPPFLVPANRLLSIPTRHVINESLIPWFTLFQFAPSSVDKNIPSPSVPANIADGLISKVRM